MNARVCDGKKDPDAAAGIENLTNDHAKPQKNPPARLAFSTTNRDRFPAVC